MSLAKPFSDRTVVVTGSASGIGRSTALRLASDGATVICADLHQGYSPVGGQSSQPVPTDELIMARQGVARFHECNVAQESDTDALFDVTDAAPPLWGVVLCAGVFERNVSILDETVGEHDRVMEVNERGIWLGLRAAGRALCRGAAGGRIVCIGSVSGLVGLANEPAYCASKRAVVNLVRAAALDLAPFQITVNALCPGFIETPMLARELVDPTRRAQLEASAPLGRLGQPAEVAAAAAFLLSDHAAFITGVALPIDGGYTCG